MTPPLPEQIQQALFFIDQHRLAGTAVAVHCLMGQGRTGTILAAYLIRDGMPADEAIARLREICPGAVESPSQRHALALFAQRRDWVL
jgi:atypical dual specificity phosphatase